MFGVKMGLKDTVKKAAGTVKEVAKDSKNNKFGGDGKHVGTKKK